MSNAERAPGFEPFFAGESRDPAAFQAGMGIDFAEADQRVRLDLRTRQRAFELLEIGSGCEVLLLERGA